MRILITGASGFLGQHLVAKFMEQYEEIELYCLVNHSQNLIEALSEYENVKCWALDLTDEQKVGEWFRTSVPKLDVCVHTAAISNPRACENEPEKAHAVNVPEAFLRQLQKDDTYVVAMSTDQVYPGTDPPYKETDAVRPVNVYGQTKRNMELFLLENKIPCAILRSSIILGPQAPFIDAHDTFLHFCASRKNQETVFYTDERRSVVSVRDVVNVIQHCVNHRPCGVYNLGGASSISRYDMARAVFEHCDYDTSYLVAAEKKAMPSSSDVASPLDITIDCQKVHQLVGKAFEPLEDMVKATFARVEYNS